MFTVGTVKSVSLNASWIISTVSALLAPGTSWGRQV
jgi:hypothetical protein